ncbi:MAG: ligand-binding sensor domain-containing protein, partial [Candidatus Latescibacterota bacterium]
MSLYTPKTNTFRNFSAADGLASNKVMAIHEDRKDHIYFGHWSNGVSRLNVQTGVWESFGGREGLDLSEVVCMVEDRQGNMWLGGRRPGHLYRYDGTRFETYDLGAPASDNYRILSLLEDQSGMLWAGLVVAEGGDRGGVLQINPHEASDSTGFALTRYRMDDGLADNEVWSL